MNSVSFNREMLTLAREAAGLTQEMLAARAGISQGRLSKIENGLLAPDQPTVVALAKAVEYPESFFLQEGHNYPLPLYRKRASVPQRELDKINALINIRALQVRTLLKSAEFEPELEIRRTDSDAVDGDVEAIARAHRIAWRLPKGPVANVTRLLERAGILVIEMTFGTDKIDGITQLVPGLPPLIFVNRESPADRIRYTLMHELGHVVMHPFPSVEMENEANRFASEFLMPLADIKHHLMRVSLPVLAALKPVWKVSMAALLERAKRIGTITERQYIRVRSELSSRQYLKREPAELDFPREEAKLFLSLVEFHRTKLSYGLNDLASILHDQPERIQRWYEPGTARGLRLVG